jgi:hypothetical protein
VRHVEPDPEPFADRPEKLGPIRLLGVVPRAEVDQVLAVLVERHRRHADAAADPEQQWLDALAVGSEALDATCEQRVCERRGLALPTGHGGVESGHGGVGHGGGRSGRNERTV